MTWAKASATRSSPSSSANASPLAGSRSRSTSAAVSSTIRIQSGSSGPIARRTSAISGSNQRPRRSRTTWRAASGPSADMYTSAVWATQVMREIRGMASPSSPSGRPLPSQCSSRARTASAAAGEKPRSATMRAPRSQRALLSAGRLARDGAQGAQELAGARDARGSRAHIGRGEADEVARAGPVDERELAFEGAVVGVEELAHAGGAARAPGVLQQRGVEEVLPHPGREVEPLGDLHADHAAALGVPDGLALGQVEGVRERPDDLGEAVRGVGRPEGRGGARGARSGLALLARAGSGSVHTWWIGIRGAASTPSTPPIVPGDSPRIRTPGPEPGD